MIVKAKMTKFEKKEHKRKAKKKNCNLNREQIYLN